MLDRDDQDWLNALAGKQPEPSAELAVVKDGAIARHAMLAARQRQPALRFDVDLGLRRLLARLREGKLLESSAPRRMGWGFMALAAVAMLGLAFGIAVKQRPPKPPAAAQVPVLPGAPGAAQVVVTPDAREIAAELSSALAEAGLAPTVTESGSITRLEADWPSRPSDKQLEFLRTYGFARPQSPPLRIEVQLPPQ